MRKILILLGFIYFTFTLFGQKADSDELIKNINKDVIKFLVKENELDKNYTYEEYLKRFFIIEMVENKVIGYNEIGLYRFSTTSSPSYTYLLLKNGKNYKFLNLRNIDTVLIEVLNFLIDIKMPKDKTVKYIEKVISVYKGNRYNDDIRM